MNPGAVKWPLITVIGCDGGTKIIYHSGVKVSHDDGVYSAACTSCSPRNRIRLVMVTGMYLRERDALQYSPYSVSSLYPWVFFSFECATILTFLVPEKHIFSEAIILKL